MAEESGDEPCIPRAALNKLVKEIVPHVRVANESRDLLHTCCIEFVKTVGAEANRICAQEQKKTISQEHVLKALESLGFGVDYVQAAQSVLDECKEAAQKRLQRQNSRLDKCGIPEEVLLQRQQELFEKARADQAEQEQAQIALFQQFLAAQQLQQQQMLLQQQQQQAGIVGGESGVIRNSSDVQYVHVSLAAGDETKQPIDLHATVAATGSASTSAAMACASSRIAELDEDYDAPE